MIRTLIYMPEEDYRAVEFMAQRTHESKAKIIRTFISKGLQEEYKKSNLGLALKKLSELSFHSGDPDFSKNIDKYLYDGV